MRHIRYPQWMVLTCMTAIAACTSTGGDEGSVGNTEFNVVIPDAEGTDVQSVEYTINCLGNATEFLNNLASFPDEVTINGNLEVVEPGQGPNFPADAEIRQGYMDLPPGPCTAELRARDNDDEVICTAQEPFNVQADQNTVVELVLICGLSFQADVGTADIIGTFQYNVANFCPDLFVLNCLESFPQVPVDENNQPTGPAVSTCEVRYRDGDSTCGTSCDPQTCEADGLAGIICTQPGGDPLPGGFDPGPDPGVQTTVTCGGADMACNGGAFGQTSCAWSGDQLGTVAINAAIVGNPAMPVANDASKRPNFGRAAGGLRHHRRLRRREPWPTNGRNPREARVLRRRGAPGRRRPSRRSGRLGGPSIRSQLIWPSLCIPRFPEFFFRCRRRKATNL